MATNESLRLPSSPTAMLVAGNSIMAGFTLCLREADSGLPGDMSGSSTRLWVDSQIPNTASNSCYIGLAEQAVNQLPARTEGSDAHERGGPAVGAVGDSGSAVSRKR